MVAAFIATAVAAILNWYACWKDLRTLESISKPLTTIGAIAIALLAGGPDRRDDRGRRRPVLVPRG
jgi:hypothetical protein